MLGFFLIAALDALKVKGAILIGILAITVIAIALGLQPFGGIVSTPPSIAPTFFKLDIVGALGVGILQVILVFVLVEVFDATGTLIGVAKRAGLLEEGPSHTSPQLGKALLADSSAIVAGSFLGTSSTTAYVESASGVLAGGRTGLTAVVVGVLFLLALFFSPLAGSVPAFATAPALLFVACLMMRELDRHRLGRHHRGGAGGADRDHDALHLLDRQRPRLRLHQLCDHQGADRAGGRGASGDLDRGGALSHPLRLLRRLASRTHTAWRGGAPLAERMKSAAQQGEGA